VHEMPLSKIFPIFFDDEQEHRGVDVCSVHFMELPNNGLLKHTPREDTYDP